MFCMKSHLQTRLHEHTLRADDLIVDGWLAATSSRAQLSTFTIWHSICSEKEITIHPTTFLYSTFFLQKATTLDLV